MQTKEREKERKRKEIQIRRRRETKWLYTALNRKITLGRKATLGWERNNGIFLPLLNK